MSKKNIELPEECKSIATNVQQYPKDVAQVCELAHPTYLENGTIDSLSLLFFALMAATGLLGTIYDTKKDSKKKGKPASSFNGLTITFALVLTGATMGAYLVDNQKSALQDRKQCEIDDFAEIRDANLEAIGAQTTCLTKTSQQLQEALDTIDKQTLEIQSQSNGISEQVASIHKGQLKITQVTAENASNKGVLQAILSEVQSLKPKQPPTESPPPPLFIEYTVNIVSIDAISQCAELASNEIYWSLGVDGEQITNLLPKSFTPNVELDNEKIQEIASSYKPASIKKFENNRDFNIYGYVRHKTGTSLFGSRVKYIYSAMLDETLIYKNGEKIYDTSIDVREGCKVLIKVSIEPIA